MKGKRVSKDAEPSADASPRKSSYELRLEAGLRSVLLTLPRAYHTVLQNEAKALGLPRGTFMTQLLRASMGQVNFTPRTQNRYVFARKDFAEKVRFSWSLNQDSYELFEKATHYGAMPPSAWAMATLDNWLGPESKPRIKE